MASPLSQAHRAMCLDGCDTDIALHGLCPHSVVSQVVWGSVAAWTDLHGVRLTDDEVLAATTSLDAGEHETDAEAAVIQSLPRITDLRCTEALLLAAPDVLSKLRGFECSSRDNSRNDDHLLHLLHSGSPRLRRLASVHPSGTDLLKQVLQRVEGFSGFGWPGADTYRSWLLPVSPSLTRLSLGYVDPVDVLRILLNAPATLRDIALQGWNSGSDNGRHEVFNAECPLPAHIEGFELQDSQPHHRTMPRLRIWAFLLPAAAQLRYLSLSASLTPVDFEHIIEDCPRLEALHISLWQSDDTATARRLLFTNAGLPLLRRLVIGVVCGSGSWTALEKVADKQGRSTITALSLGLVSPVTGEQLRPFAPRLSELAVRELSTPGGYFPTCPLLTSLAVRTRTDDLRDVVIRQRELMPHLRRICLCSKKDNDPPLLFGRVVFGQATFSARGRLGFV